MEWFYFSTWAVFALASLNEDKRYAGDEGRERLLALDTFEARTAQKSYRASWSRGLLVAVATIYAINAVALLVEGRWLVAALAVASGAVCVAAIRSRARTAPHVLAVLDERDLSEPSILRETSQRRRLRVKQYGAVAALAFLTALPPLVVGDSTFSTVVGVVLLSVTGLALAAMAWASAWRYGDEQPAPEPDPKS